MARASYLKKEEYDYIKLLQSKGRKISEIVDTTGRSEKTVRRACRTNGYTNYIDENHAERKARDEREAEQQKMSIDFADDQPKEINKEQEEERVVSKAVVSISDLSSKDKKELAMYAIDQHYFFLKQLTGVI